MNSKTIPAFITALILGSGILAAPVYANEEVENACMEQADEQNIPDDKYDEFVSNCVAEAMKKVDE
jgi:hypothetical protein